MSSKFSIRTCFQSFKYATQGIWYTILRERNFLIQLIIAVLVVLAGFYFELDLNEWLWVIISIAFVLTTELINTAIERMVDLIHPQQGEKAGLIKDIAAGAVLIASIFAVIIGLLIFLPKIL